MVSFKITFKNSFVDYILYDPESAYLKYSHGNRECCHLQIMEMECKGPGGNFWVMEMFSILIDYTDIYTYEDVLNCTPKICAYHSVNFTLLDCGEKMFCATIILIDQSIS